MNFFRRYFLVPKIESNQKWIKILLIPFLLNTVTVLSSFFSRSINATYVQIGEEKRIIRLKRRIDLASFAIKFMEKSVAREDLGGGALAIDLRRK